MFVEFITLLDPVFDSKCIKYIWEGRRLSFMARKRKVTTYRQVTADMHVTDSESSD